MSFAPTPISTLTRIPRTQIAFRTDVTLSPSPALGTGTHRSKEHKVALGPTIRRRIFSRHTRPWFRFAADHRLRATRTRVLRRDLQWGPGVTTCQNGRVTRPLLEGALPRVLLRGGSTCRQLSMRNANRFCLPRVGLTQRSISTLSHERAASNSRRSGSSIAACELRAVSRHSHERPNSKSSAWRRSSKLVLRGEPLLASTVRVAPQERAASLHACLSVRCATSLQLIHFRPRPLPQGEEAQ